MAAPRYRALVNGLHKLVAAITSSSGAADAEKIVATNTSGVLDDTLMGAATTGASKVLKTRPDGTIDPTTLPSGIGGAATATLTASEAIGAGKLVNVWNDGGTAKVRLADATTFGKQAHGYVIAAVAQSAAATVYFDDRNTQVTGRTPGATQYLAKTPGDMVEDVSTYVAGNVVQVVGTAYGATAVDFEAGEPIELA